MTNPSDEPPSAPTVGEKTLEMRPSPGSREHPAVAEARVRARSKYLVISGVVMTIAIMALAGVWHAGFGSFLPAVYAIPLYAVSCGAVLLGCSEYITRHTRAQLDRTVQIALQVRADQIRLVELLGEELKQRYYAGCADTIEDQRDEMLRSTGTGGPAVGRAAPPNANRSGGDVLKLRRRPGSADRNDAHY